ASPTLRTRVGGMVEALAAFSAGQPAPAAPSSALSMPGALKEGAGMLAAPDGLRVASLAPEAKDLLAAPRK
ncbi:hypothetical protein, partial [Duganella vulcania]